MGDQKSKEKCRNGAGVSMAPAVASVQVVITDGPATCRHCGQVFESYRIRKINDRPLLIDLNGNLIFELVLMCHACNERWIWRHSFEPMYQDNLKYKRLMAHYERVDEKKP